MFRVLRMYNFAWNFYRTSTHIRAHLIHGFVLFLNGIPLALFKHFTNVEIEYLKKWRMFWKRPSIRAIEILTFSYKNLTVTIFFGRPYLITKKNDVNTNSMNKSWPHQIVSPISNLQKNLTNVCYDFFFKCSNWERKPFLG